MDPRKTLANVTRGVLRSMGFRAVTKTVHGAPMRVPIAVGHLRSLLFDATYNPFLEGEEIVDLLFDRIEPGDVVFDIGAWHGFHSCLFARKAGRVVSFEPNPRAFAVLQETIAVNRLKNVAAHQLAVSRDLTVGELWGSGSGASLRPGSGKVGRNRVEVVRLDDFTARSIQPTVLKIDVEGAEYDVLAGGGRCLSHCRVVCLEMHFEELPKFAATPEMVHRLMREAGFTETARRAPEVRHVEDPTRLHLLFEKP